MPLIKQIMPLLFPGEVLIDNQLPVALAAFIRGKNFDAAHVVEVGLDRAGDKEIWEFAQREGRIIISKDEDFFHMAKQQPVVQLIWVRRGNCRKLSLLAAFEKFWETLEQGLLAGEHVIEMR